VCREYSARGARHGQQEIRRLVKLSGEERERLSELLSQGQAKEKASLD
jgi:hypothetical protein